MRYYLDVSPLFFGQIRDHQQQINVDIVARVSGRASVCYWERNVRRVISILPRSLIGFSAGCRTSVHSRRGFYLSSLGVKTEKDHVMVQQRPCLL